MAKTKKRNPFEQERADFAKFHATAEKQILPIVRRALAKSIQPVIDYVTASGTNVVPVDLLVKGNVWMEMYVTIAQQIGMKAARKEYYNQRTLEGLTEEKASVTDFFKDVWSGKLRDWAINYANGIAQDLNDTTIELIRRALGDDAMIELDQLGRTRFFISKIKGIMRTRSLTISRTESTTLSNLGKDIGARTWIEESGLQGYKAWLGRNDEKERKTHLDENNTIIEIDDYFDLAGDLCERPGDIRLQVKNRANCRCTATYMSQNRRNALQKAGRIVNGKII